MLSKVKQYLRQNTRIAAVLGSSLIVVFYGISILVGRWWTDGAVSGISKAFGVLGIIAGFSLRHLLNRWVFPEKHNDNAGNAR